MPRPLTAHEIYQRERAKIRAREDAAKERRDAANLQTAYGCGCMLLVVMAVAGFGLISEIGRSRPPRPEAEVVPVVSEKNHPAVEPVRARRAASSGDDLRADPESDPPPAVRTAAKQQMEPLQLACTWASGCVCAASGEA